MDEQFFTEHVRSVLDGTFDNDPAILVHLKRELRRQLRNIGQWNLSPSYLGFDGESWESSDALNELAQETYIFCIQKRLTTLGEHLAITGSCEGSVRRKISWFLQDRQEKGNPISRRIYRNVRTASESLIERGKAEASQSGKLTGKTQVLAVGRSISSSAEELASSLSKQLGDQDFVKLISRNCPTSWRLIESTIERSFGDGVHGYQIGELSKLLSDTCKKPDRIVDADADEEESFGNIWGSISEIRTDVRTGRYSVVSEVDHQDQFAVLQQKLIQTAQASINNERIRSRVLKMIEKIAELIREGADIRELSCRKLSSLLGISKSTLAEDIARLQIHDRAQEDHTSEMES